MASAKNSARQRVAPTLPFTALSPTEVFAVEDTMVQLTWRGLSGGSLGCKVHHRSGTDAIELGDVGACLLYTSDAADE